MHLFRITRKKYAEDLSGQGAANSNINRWNNKGTAMIYTAESIAVARAELSGHVNLSLIPDAVLIVFEVPDDMVEALKHIPENFDEIPPNAATKSIGDEFVASKKFLGLKVPSRYDEQSYNVLLNPGFPDFNRLVKVKEIKPFITSAS